MGFLRTFLALSVFYWHMATDTGHFLLNGALSVMSFYVVSGFLMSLTCSQNYQNRDNGNRLFFFNRFLRIFPAYWLVIALTVIFHFLTNAPGPFLGYENARIVPSMAMHAATLVSNTLILGTDLLSFLGRIGVVELPLNARLFSPSWSIANELWFYLAVPFIVRRSSGALVALIMIATVTRWALGHGDEWPNEIDPWRYFIAPSTWIFFLLGMLSFRLARPILALTTSRATFPLAIATLATTMTIAGIDRFVSLDSVQIWIYYICLMLTLPLLWSVSRPGSWDEFVGRFSYPIYLLHPLLIEIYQYYFGMTKPELFRYGTLTFALAAGVMLLYLCVERPIDNLRTSIRRRKRPAPVAER